MSSRVRPFARAIALAAVLAVAAAPAAQAKVIEQHLGGATAHTPIVGSDQHLPPLAATTPYMIDPSVGAKIVAWRKSGGYAADITGTVVRARNYLDRWLTKRCGRDASPARVRKCRAMLVADIDDTLVSWYSYYANTDAHWTANAAAEKKVMEACGTPAITPSVNLLRYAKGRGVAIVLITGRSQGHRSFTASCVKKLGVNGYRDLVMRSPAQSKTTAARYKSQARRTLVRAGWKIALSLGDQVSDMSGGYADAGFLLPNPMYLIP